MNFDYLVDNWRHVLDLTVEHLLYSLAHDSDGERIHFLDWDGPARPRASGVVAIHGLGQTAWAWTPAAGRTR